MSKTLLVIGVLLTFIVACSAWFWPFSTETPAVFQHENVLSLTKENFEEVVSFLRHVCVVPRKATEKLKRCSLGIRTISHMLAKDCSYQSGYPSI